MSDDSELSDYLDGRLAPGEKAVFEARLCRDPDLSRRLCLLRALRASLAASVRPMPADLKAALKREAAARMARPSWRGLLRESLAAHRWSYGAGAAFAAAALVLVVRSAVAPPPPPAPVARVEPRAPEAAAPSVASSLADLWTDDDGGDENEG
ncbi:MAG: hypothetical protein A2X40_08970 [Elusimicrobia bacterium GWC2_65_9]|nr:MAG: hypothetical protein A2X40_08970 [Elusimicrobia bacterium GWC2_65_9]